MTTPIGKGLLLMIQEHCDLAVPNDEVMIWRYMSFSKFVAILDRRAIYFPRADCLEDHWEGVIPRSLLNWIETQFKDKLPEWAQGNSFAEHFRNVEISRQYLSCWHQSEIESAAMWSLYGVGNDAVAIQSSVGRLRRSLDVSGTLDMDQKVDVMIGTVIYGDHNDWQFPNECSGDPYAIPFFFKRRSFWFEQEFRAKVDGKDFVHCPDGIYVTADLSALIERVYVAPQGPNWCKLLVKSILGRYGFPADESFVVQSVLDSDTYM